MAEKILHLTLKKKWFDMIASGDKTEEYRELKPYWIRRLFDFDYPEEAKNDYNWIAEDFAYDLLNGHPFKTVINSYWSKVKDYDSIIFSNGYSKNRPQIKVEFKGIDFSVGQENWGAEINKKYLVLKLGNLIKV